MKNQVMYGLIDKIIYLEERIGSKTGYKILNPSDVQEYLNFSYKNVNRDIVAVQKLAKFIGEFIGLGDYTFIVVFTDLGQNLGGQVELDNSRTVFIKISYKTLEYHDALIATLCHEISHKYLQVNNLYYNNVVTTDYENEILTDTVGVYLGFGKLMLNGYWNTRTETLTDASGQKFKRKHSLKTGYLSTEELAFIYLLLCRMRNINKHEYLKQLDGHADFRVRMSIERHKKHIDPLGKKAHNQLIKEMKELMFRKQLMLSLTEKCIRYVQQAFITPTFRYLKEAHTLLFSIHSNFNRIMENEKKEHNPILKNLYNIRLETYCTEIDRRNSLNKLNKWHNNAAQTIADSVQRLGKVTPPEDIKNYNIITCPLCAKKMRLPEKMKNIIAKCPDCRYEFSTDTTSEFYVADLNPVNWFKDLFKST